ncbi:MAG: glycosyltransferase family 9 protein [Armatimonadetes bacterium]|nr:glycosyltransferase family 9 protein [Armatimonadota bacterium]
MPPAGPESVLIIRMSALGDIICALPVLRAIRDSFPETRIGWVVDSRFEDLLAPDPDIHRLHVAPVSRWKKLSKSPLAWPRLISERRALGRELRQMQYEVCLDLQGILKSGFIARAAGAKRTLHMGSGRIAKRTWLFPGERIAPISAHAVERMLPLAGAIGADISRPRFDLFIPQSDRTHAEHLFAAHSFATTGPVVALNPGAAAVHRMWAADRFATLAGRLHRELDARVVVIGGPSEVPLAQGIARDSGIDPLCTAGKTTLLQLAAVLDRCDVLVTGDTGPQHIAYALGKHVVSLFGPANPLSTGPYGPGHVVIQHSFPCQPCYAHPSCKDFACMKAIEVDEVFDAVARVLANAQPS